MNCVIGSVLQLFDAATLNHLKTYKTSRPVNSAAISPTRDHVCQHSYLVLGCIMSFDSARDANFEDHTTIIKLSFCYSLRLIDI